MKSMLKRSIRILTLLTITVLFSGIIAVGQESTKPVKPFYVYKDAGSPENHFNPSGYMGDCGDIIITETSTENPAKGSTCIKVTYSAKGKGPNKCDYPAPCKWAGVYWLNPPNNWGSMPKNGYDLGAFNTLKFYAKAETSCEIEFKVGGVSWIYGDSQREPKGIKVRLSNKWEEYSIPLKGGSFIYVIGGFCFVTNKLSCPNGIVFYLDEIRFE